DDSVDERIKEVAQIVLASHSRKGGMKDNEVSLSETTVKNALKDAAKISGKQMEDVVGCKFTKDGDRLFINYKNQMPQAAQGESDIINEAQQGLLSVVLMFIHMTKNPLISSDKVKDSALWEFLEMLEVRQTSIHPVFGLPSKLIAPSNSAEFVAQGWLSFEKKKGDPDEIYYDWGGRAVAVVNPKEILETYCEIVGDKAEEWKEHVKIGKEK
ncbi:hypothetical protein PENTCL1PPCAC_26322, partial [Pristionchus entomophagus]